MLSEDEVRKIAQRVVTVSKASAHVDTGALKRSISFTYVKGVVIFRQLFYGQFNENSQLERNATRLMPIGTRWKIIFTAFGGQTIEVSRTRAGRRSQKSILNTLLTGTTNNIKALIARNRVKRKKEEDSNGS